MPINQIFPCGIWTRDLSEIAARLLAGIVSRIPFGYENETGFHYGIESINSFLERLSEKCP